MAVSLYVGNLPYSITEQTLTDLFAQAGSVQGVRLPTDRETGQPRGFGFVEMESDADAQKAIQMFDGYFVDSRALRVNIAEERGPRGGGGRGGRDGGRY